MAANSFFDWVVSTVRFVPRDTARAEDVNSALDEVSNGFTDVEVKTDAAIKLQDGETAPDLGDAATRKGTVLSFNASTGAPEATIATADVATVAADIANVNAVATDIANVNAVATDIANVNACAADLANIDAASGYATAASNSASSASGYATAASGSADAAAASEAAAAATLTAAMKKDGDSDLDMNNHNIIAIKSATFNSQAVLTTTSGAVTVDWSAAQNYKQNEPTGAITYTFTAPPGPCHLQLLIDSDGTSTAQTITWPGTVVWIGTAWSGANNKKAIINFWYDGTNYFAMGANEV